MGLQDALRSEPALAAIEAASRYYADMEQRLATGDWLAGSYSFADIAFYMAALFGERQGAPFRSHAAPLAWRERMGQRAPVSDGSRRHGGVAEGRRPPGAARSWIVSAESQQLRERGEIHGFDEMRIETRRRAPLAVFRLAVTGERDRAWRPCAAIE